MREPRDQGQGSNGVQPDCSKLKAGLKMLADTDNKHKDSADEWLNGFAPTCFNGSNAAVANGWTHELFNEGDENMLYPGCTYANESEVSALYGEGAPDAWINTNLGSAYEFLAKVIPLQPSACHKATGTCRLIDLPNTWEKEEGAWKTWNGSWKTAAWMAVVLQTQFVNGNAVYKNLSSEEVAFLSTITYENWLAYKNPINANRFAGPNYAAFLMSEMSKAFDGHDRDMARNASMEPRPKLTWSMTHDVNVAFAAGLSIQLAHLNEVPSRIPRVGLLV